MPHRSRLTLLAVVLGVMTVWMGRVFAQAPAPSPLPLPNSFRMDESFKLEMPKGLTTLGSVSAVKVGPDNNVYVFHRCVANSCTGHDDIDPILVYNQKGKLLRQMGKGMFVWPHGMVIMPDLSMWVTDGVAPNGRDPKNPGKGHQVFHLDRNGKVLLALGKPGMPGQTPDTFDAPSDVLIAKNGDIFVADGHGMGTGTRVVKFDKSGKYLMEWGGKGNGPTQFEVPHGSAMDSQGRIYVADRPNNRITIFDQNGKFVAEWKQFGRPSGLAIDRNDNIFVTDTQTTKGRTGWENGIYIGSAKDGKVTGFIPKIRPHSTWEGDLPDYTNMEAIGVTQDGNTIYGGEVGLMTVIKFVKK